MRSEKGYLYVYCIRNGEIHILLGRGKPYNLNGLLKLKDCCNGRVINQYSLCDFGIKGALYGYRSEKVASLKNYSKESVKKKLQDYIIRVAKGEKFLSAPAFDFNADINKRDTIVSYGKYFGGLISNPWTSVMGGEKEKADSNLKSTVIREFMEETGLVVFESCEIKYDKSNLLRKKFYQEAFSNVKLFHEDRGKNVHLYALRLEYKDMLAIKDQFYSASQMPGENKVPNDLKNSDDLNSAYENIDEYKEIKKIMILEKRELIILPVNKLKEYYKKEGDLYAEDQKYAENWSKKLSEFFVEFLPPEKRSLQLSHDLEKIVLEHFNDTFKNFQSELDKFEKHVIDKNKFGAYNKVPYCTLYYHRGTSEEPFPKPITSLCL